MQIEKTCTGLTNLFKHFLLCILHCNQLHFMSSGCQRGPQDKILKNIYPSHCKLQFWILSSYLRCIFIYLVLLRNPRDLVSRILCVVQSVRPSIQFLICFITLRTNTSSKLILVYLPAYLSIFSYVILLHMSFSYMQYETLALNLLAYANNLFYSLYLSCLICTIIFFHQLMVKIK